MFQGHSLGGNRVVMMLTLRAVRRRRWRRYIRLMENRVVEQIRHERILELDMAREGDRTPTDVLTQIEGQGPEEEAGDKDGTTRETVEDKKEGVTEY